MPHPLVRNINHSWLSVLKLLTEAGQLVSPRGMNTYEYPQVTIATRLDDPVLTIGLRKLNYRFMAAEARWILSGSDNVAEIARYNSQIAKYSDDGDTFYGAYGPRYRDQLPGVVQKLANDPDTRQAGMTFWRQNPPDTKDVPCTVSVFFQVRFGELNVHVFMRSSDAWLGLPYDTFNFSMMGYHVLGFLNQRRAGHGVLPPAKPGVMYLTMASSHIYEQHIEPAKNILTMFPDPDVDALRCHRLVPECLAESELTLDTYLTNVADGDFRVGRWWMQL